VGYPRVRRPGNGSAAASFPRKGVRAGEAPTASAVEFGRLILPCLPCASSADSRRVTLPLRGQGGEQEDCDPSRESSRGRGDAFQGVAGGCSLLVSGRTFGTPRALLLEHLGSRVVVTLRCCDGDRQHVWRCVTCRSGAHRASRAAEVDALVFSNAAATGASEPGIRAQAA